MLGRPNRVLVWICGHIPSRILEFFLADWIQEYAIRTRNAKWWYKLCEMLETRTIACCATCHHWVGSPST